MSTKHSADRGELGRRGEALACARLTEAGLRIVVRNWRCQTGEIDVVAEGPGLLVFCEVKTGGATATAPRRPRSTPPSRSSCDDWPEPTCAPPRTGRPGSVSTS
jgi:putative endonuclease